MLRFDVIQPFWPLTWTMLYLITFQILINLFKKSVKEESQEKANSIFKVYKDKNQLKWFNFTCFLINSITLFGYLTLNHFFFFLIVNVEFPTLLFKFT